MKYIHILLIKYCGQINFHSTNTYKFNSKYILKAYS